MKFCWLYQKAISCAADSQAEPSRWVQKHLLTCSQCRRFHQAESRLSAALVAGANAHMTEFPPLLHARIMSRVEEQSR